MVRVAADDGVTVWLTGLPAAGKTTLAKALQGRLQERQTRCCLLDGDTVRTGLSADLRFSPEDRRENVRRVAEVAKILNGVGVTAVVALISPLASDRALARRIVGEARFLEVFVDAPLSLCESRDPKGLYRRAREGTMQDLTGLSAPYERPHDPELHLRTGETGIAACVDLLEALFRPPVL